MSVSTIIELVGYLGSALVLVAFLMTSVVKLRVVNSIGSLIFAIYALIIHSYPTALMNICLVIINIRFLLHLRNTEKNYDLVDASKDDSFVQYLLRYYKEDILKCFPGISLDFSDHKRSYIVCCDSKPVGMLFGEEEKGTMNIALDYSIPEFRDCSIGQYINSELPKKGIHTLVYGGPTENHKEYLNKLGYVLKNDVYVKEL